MSFQDDNRDILDDNTPVTIGADLLWSVFRTNDFTGGAASLPGLSVDIVNNSGPGGPVTLAMQKVAVRFDSSEGIIRISDFSNRDGNPDMEITISNVTVPTITATTTPDEFMLTAASEFCFLQDGVEQFCLTAIPEPSAFVFGAMVIGMVGARRRFFSKKSEE